MKLPSFAVLLLSLACSNLGPSARPCPSMVVSPHAMITFAKPLVAGGYQVELELDGSKESCALEIGPSIPGQEMGGAVMGPRTETKSTCKSLGFAHVAMDGSISDLRLSKPNEKMSVPFSFKLSMGGVVVVESNTPLEFKPTDTLGEGCGKTDVATLTLAQKQ
jgi:hypothetical protein